MRGRSPFQSLAASPTMVGAITTLIVIVAVFLAYNANNGLPFVPVYRVTVDVPNAARLVRNNEVRVGGHRVGVIETIEAVSDSEASQTAAGDGTAAGEAAAGAPKVIARLNLKLDKTAEPLPVDSVFRVRYKSTFGLKFLEIIRGTGRGAPEGFQFDGTDDGAICELPVDLKTYGSQIPESSKNGCFQAQTEFDEIGNTFDRPTRENSRLNLEGYGSAFAGRGASLNDAIASLRPLFRNLKPVAEALAAPETRFARFFSELGDAARIVVPVAAEQARMFGFMATTFAAISEDTEALQATISEGVPTLETGLRILPAQRIFLREFGILSRELRPGVADLRATLPTLNRAVSVGTPVLRRTVKMNTRLRGALRELQELVDQPETKRTFERLRDTFAEARPLIEYVAPYQTVCNYWNYDWYNIWEHLSQRDSVGFLERVYTVGFPPGTGPTGQQGSPGGYSGIQANGKTALDGDLGRPGVQHVFDPDNLAITHGPPYSQAVDEDGNADCHSGQHGYPLGQALVPGQPASSPVFGVSHYPDDPRGPTYAGRSREP